MKFLAASGRHDIKSAKGCFWIFHFDRLLRHVDPVFRVAIIDVDRKAVRYQTRFWKLLTVRPTSTQHAIIVNGITTGSSANGIKKQMNSPAMMNIVPRTL